MQPHGSAAARQINNPILFVYLRGFYPIEKHSINKI